jgi:hypothetical protein
MVKEQNKKYENTYAFRRALEDRLNNLSKKEGIALDRLRRMSWGQISTWNIS